MARPRTSQYGERSRVLEQLRAPGHNPPAFKTCANAGSIARAFETSRRREALSFDHHGAVTKLDEANQDWLLDRAEENKWSRAGCPLHEVRGVGAQKAVQDGDLAGCRTRRCGTPARREKGTVHSCYS